MIPPEDPEMKHHAKGRPIGKCKGCCLNFRRLCAADLEPTAEWSRGRCRARNDPSYLDRFYRSTPSVGAEAAREARRARAAATKTEPHYDGHVFVPARRGPFKVR